jgi:hypothetical protein
VRRFTYNAGETLNGAPPNVERQTLNIERSPSVTSVTSVRALLFTCSRRPVKIMELKEPIGA